MPCRLDTHVLTVDANVIHKVDTANPQNLFSMWTVFSRCADSVEQGRRLENLSWRLWNRETFCCETAAKATSAPITVPALPRAIPSESRIPEAPQLSRSIDSIESDDALEFTSTSEPVEIVRPRIRRQNSCTSNRSRGRERHITSGDFEKMVSNIVNKTEPLTAPLPDYTPSPLLEPRKELDSQPPSFERSGSTTTEASTASDGPSESSQQPSSPEMTNSRTQVVRGFSPASQVSIPRTVVTQPPKTSSPPVIPDPRSTPAHRPVQSKKQQATFALGGSYSSSDQGQSVEEAKRPIPPPKRKIFQVGGSSEEESSLKSALASGPRNSHLTVQKKQTSFNDIVATRTIVDTAAVDDSETENDYVDESAIDDDDDSSDWEDSIEDSNKSSIDEKTFFQRVDSKANLTSRRSLITLMFEGQNERARKLGNAASQSTSALPRSRTMPLAPMTSGAPASGSPNDSDDQHLMMKKGVRSSPLKPISEVSRTAAQPILATANHTHHQAALSPRTTRRNMLATELTESLRRHLLWERQQKSSTANAVLKRRHTSHDVANLKQYPEKPYMNKNEDVNASSWNQYFGKDANGYHSKGW